MALENTIVEGQFDDAVEPTEALKAAPDFNPREGQSFIDDHDPTLQWSDPESESELEEEEGEEEEEYGDSLNDLHVDDEDWEMAEKGTYFPSQWPCYLYSGQISRSNTTE
jgi:hypothetical protein